jgi:RNA polymerase sigma-70 factor (ECF subfamily)
MMRVSEIPSSDAVVRLRVDGRLTERNVDAFREVAEPFIGAGKTTLFDVSGVDFVDAAGAEALSSAARKNGVLVGCSKFLVEMGSSDVDRRVQRPSAEPEANEEAPLLRRLQAGEDAAYAELVTRYAPRLLTTARRFLRQEDDARDAVQDAMLCAFRAIGSFNGEARLSTWLHRIVVDAALMKLRTRRRHPEQSIEELLPSFDKGGAWAQETKRWCLPSEELLERRSVRERVRRCIEQLPETYRTVLVMRDIEDLDTDEVAEMLGATPNAVKIRLHRARQALRTLLEQELDLAGDSAGAAPTAQPRGLTNPAPTKRAERASHRSPGH